MDYTIAVLVKRGLAEDKAAHYAGLIGDTPELDDNGKWVIAERDGTIIDRIDPID